MAVSSLQVFLLLVLHSSSFAVASACSATGVATGSGLQLKGVSVAFFISLESVVST